METNKKHQSFSHFRPIFATMKPVIIIGLLFHSLLSLPLVAQEQQMVVPFTLADRDRAIRTETKMEVNFASQQRQLDSQNTFLFWGFGIMFSMFLFMLGYMIWDRRTATKPALQQASKSMEHSRDAYLRPS